MQVRTVGCLSDMVNHVSSRYRTDRFLRQPPGWSGLPPGLATGADHACIYIGGIHTMSNHQVTTVSIHLPKGIAFEIADLRRMQDWAGYHKVRMLISLDHGAGDDEEYEEVICLYTETSSSGFLLIWRNTKSVFAQIPIGRQVRYRSVSHLLESIVAIEGADKTDTPSRLVPDA